MSEQGPSDEPRMVSCPAEAKEVFGGEKAIDGESIPVPTLDEAIEHAEQVAFMLKDDNHGCAEEHERLADWLKELRHLRLQNAGLLKRIQEMRADWLNESGGAGSREDKDQG